MKEYLDKLKDLINTGDPEDISQAIVLAESLFDKNSREMKEFKRALAGGLRVISSKIVSESSYPYWEVKIKVDILKEDTRYRSAPTVALQVNVPTIAEVALLPTKRGFALKVDLMWDEFYYVEQDPYQPEDEDYDGSLDDYESAIERFLKKIFPLSKEVGVELDERLGKKAEDIHKKLLEQADAQLQKELPRIVEGKLRWK